MSKLPSETRLLIARKSEHDVWKIDDLLKTILSEVEALEISERVKTTNERKSNFPNNRGQNQYRTSNAGTSSALYSRERDNAYNSNKIRCAYCHFTIGPQHPDDSKARILGLNWDVETDSLYYEFDEIQRYARMLPPTKTSC